MISIDILDHINYFCNEITIQCDYLYMNIQDIGTTIRDRRKKLNLNQPTLALLADVGINTLVAIERGKGNPKTETLLSILDTLGLTIDIKLKD